MIEREHPELSLVQQCLLLGICRSSLYYESKRTVLDDEFLLKQAIDKHGKPEIYKTDQGSEFTASGFTGILIDNGIQISMDGKGRALEYKTPESVCHTAA